MHSADYAVHLLVHPSVTRRYCIKTAKHIKLFHHLVDAPLKFFRAKLYGNIRTGTVLTGLLQGVCDKKLIYR